MRREDFFVSESVEFRSDNYDIIYYVHVGLQFYAMKYDENNKIKEVYIWFDKYNYFMSCRTDMITVSHYYYNRFIDNKEVVKRYENNILNRIYYIDRVNEEIYYINEEGKKITYKRRILPHMISDDDLYNDLCNFLEQMHNHKIFDQLQLDEPKND